MGTIAKKGDYMCTAITLGAYAGRNLDIEKSYGESVIITPKRYVLPFRKCENLTEHYAFIGIGTVSRGYPLYYDAANEHGLYAAGLNYVGNAKYQKQCNGNTDLAPYELIPYLMSSCKSVSEARDALKDISLIDIPFSRELSTSELHFFIADKHASITVEPDEQGLSVYDNPIGVLTNNPPFPMQMHNLATYQGLTNEPVVNRLADSLSLKAYSRGMGALGLPGDLSSESRFVRAAFHKLNYAYSGNPCDIFHLLSTVEMPVGSLKLGEAYERTEYTSAVDLSSLEYYVRTYDGYAISSVRLFNEDLSSTLLTQYPLSDQESIPCINQ